MMANRGEAHGESPSASDAELVAAARGDLRCFAPLYERYANRLYRYLLGQTRNAADADDILSKVIVAALESFERFDPERGSLAGWLFTIARHQVATHYRADRRLWRALKRSVPPSIAGEDPFEAIAQIDAASEVHAALHQLPASDRQILLLRYSADLSGREIAEVIGISEGAVRVRLNRARRRFASKLEDGDGYQTPRPDIRPTGG